MKWILTIALVVLCYSNNTAQNPYTNTEFYEALKTIYADAGNGFVLNKGSKIEGQLSGLVDEYQTKLKLPGSLSGKVLYQSFGGNWTVEYKFAGEADLATAKEKASNVIQALSNALNLTLYKKYDEIESLHLTVHKVYYSATFKEPSILLSDFETAVYKDGGVYVVYLRIGGYGKTHKQTVTRESKLTSEPDLDSKLLSFYSDAMTCFVETKGAETESNQYMTYYSTKQTFFGVEGSVEVSKYNCELKYNFGFSKLRDLEEAKELYAKLKKSLEANLGGKMSFKEEVSSYDSKSLFTQGLESGKDILSSKSRLTVTINRDEDYPAVYFTLKRKR